MDGALMIYDGEERRRNALTEVDIERIAERLLVRTFEVLGVNLETPESRAEFRADLDHLREWRNGVRTFKNKAAGAGIFVIISGLIVALWQGIKHP